MSSVNQIEFVLIFAMLIPEENNFCILCICLDLECLCMLLESIIISTGHVGYSGINFAH